MTRYLDFLIAIIVCCCCSCNKNDDPPMEVRLPINRSFLPVTVNFNRSDADLKSKYKEWDNKLIRVDAADQLPDDPIGFSEIYRNIDFKDQTLLIYYDIYFWEINSCDFNFNRNTVEKNYNWGISLGVTDIVFEGDSLPESANFTRFAMLVRKLPENAEILTWYSLHNLDESTDWWE